MVEVSNDQLLDLIRAHIKTNFKTQSAFAASLGVSRSHVSGVLSGRKSVPMAWLGLVGATVLITTKAATGAEYYSFSISGAGFVGMPLGRVAEYMAEIAKLAGPAAGFVGMTTNEIRFGQSSEVRRG